MPANEMRILPNPVEAQGDFQTVVIELSEMHLEAVDRPRRIVLQEDANSPFEAFGLSFDQWLDLRFKHCDAPGNQIDGIWWDIGLAEDTYAVYDSRLLPKLQLEGLDDWWRQGIDWVAEIVAECHHRGLEAFWNNRVCPIDVPQPFHWSEPQPPHDHPSRTNPLKTAHADWTVPCWWPQGLWNLAMPEVRQRKVDILRELLELYELDGLQLDFARHTPCLPPGREWAMRDHLTAFVRSVRLMTLDVEQKLQRPVLLAVRVGETIEGNRYDGLDVVRWAEEDLVDIFSPGGRTTTIDFAAFARLARGKHIKLCAPFDGHHTTDGYHFPSMDYYRGVFGNFWRQSADFQSLFNWACANPEDYDRVDLPGQMKCPSHSQATREVGCLDSMAGKDRIYAVERRGGYPWAGNFVYRNDERPLPCALPGLGKTLELPLYVYEDLAHGTAAENVMIRVVLGGAHGDGAVDARLNGHALAVLRPDEPWKDGQVYGDQPQPSSGAKSIYDSHTLGQQLLKIEYPAAPSAFVVGKNSVALSSGSLNARVEKVEAHIKPPPAEPRASQPSREVSIQ